MTMSSGICPAELDAYITGNYGEDSVDELSEHCEDCDDHNDCPFGYDTMWCNEDRLMASAEARWESDTCR